MFASTHNSFVSKILAVTLFNPRFSKKIFPYPADCNRSPGEGWSTHLDLLRISCPPLSAHQNQRHAVRFPGAAQWRILLFPLSLALDPAAPDKLGVEFFGAVAFHRAPVLGEAA